MGSFHLFRFSLIYFNNVLQCSENFAIIAFIPKYFILLDVIVNGIVFFCFFFFFEFLIRFLGLLQVYKNTVDLCVSLLYFEALPNLFMYSNGFLVDSVRYSV